MGQRYCIVKRTALELYRGSHTSPSKFDLLQKSTQLKITQNHNNHHRLLERFKDLNERLKMKIRFVFEQDIASCRPQADDIIISFGGDGTFLSCAQHFPASYLLGINSDYRRFNAGKGSFGALTTLNFRNLESGLKKIAEGNYAVSEWTTLGVSLNGERLSRLAINDVYIGSRTSYQTSDLSVVYEGRQEDYLCSGLIACTGMGSHAWYRTAGGTPFSNDLKIFGFCVLMPNSKKRYQFISGIVGKPEGITIYPNRDDYVISFDSKPEVTTVGIGDTIRIAREDDSPVKVIDLK